MILDLIRKQPGLTAPEISAALGRDCGNELRNMRLCGDLRAEFLKNTGLRGRRYAYYLGDGTPDRPKYERARGGPNRSGLRARINELEAWQAAAIARYPDLAPSATQRKAREHLARFCNAETAAKVMRGEFDGTTMLRAIEDLFANSACTSPADVA